MTKPNPVPYRGIVANLTLEGAKKAIEFYRKAFDAKASECMEMPGGKVGHAELEFAGGRIMLADSFPEWGVHPVKNVRLHLYVEDCDAFIAKAVKAGAKIERPAEDQFWGDRMGTIVDPFGVSWGVATHKQDLTPEQIKQRGEEWTAKMAGKEPAGSK